MKREAGDMATLVVVPCGKGKIWDRYPDAGATPARTAYTGAPFVKNREYAEAFADRWVILSARYGFIDPDFAIPGPYDVTFNDPTTDPIPVEELRRQVREKGLASFEVVVALGSAKYAGKTQAAFTTSRARVCAPVAHLPMFEMMRAVSEAINLRRPFEC
jgi:hypothetical protein